MGLKAALIQAVVCILLVRGLESCSDSEPCSPGLCCSRWGYCGTGPAYCQDTSPPPSGPPAPTPPPHRGGGGKGKVAVYWGQNGNEGELVDTCNSGNYGIVILSFLTSFGNFQPPMLNLAGHCDPYSNACTFLSKQIKACQSSGVQVLISLGGGDSPGHLVSAADAKDLAHRLWDGYLGGGAAGNSSSRPLGPVALDGIDLDIESGATPELYTVLVKSLRGLAGGHKLVVSAAPQCPFPDANLGSAVQTPGLFDYIFVQFYNNPPCAYISGNTDLLLASWKQWTSSIPTAKIFMGLPAAPSAAGSGFLPADVCKSSVLPGIKSAKNYGGIMLWSAYYDQQDSYSSAISSSV